MAIQVSITNPDGSVTTYVKLEQVIWTDPGPASGAPGFGNQMTQLRYFGYASAAVYQSGGTAAAQNCPALNANVVVPSGTLISEPTGPTETPENVFDALAIAAGGALAGGTILP